MIKLVGAYCRNYETGTQAEKDWAEGLDFKIVGGPYTSVRDLNVLLDDWDKIVVVLNNGSEYTFAERKIDLIDRIL